MVERSARPDVLNAITSAGNTGLLRFVNQNDQCWFVAISGLKYNTINRLDVAAFTRIDLNIGIEWVLLEFGDQLAYFHRLPRSGFPPCAAVGRHREAGQSSLITN